MRIDNLKFSVETTDEEILSVIRKKARQAGEKDFVARILRKSVDARDKNNVKFVCSGETLSSFAKEPRYELKRANKKKKISIIGFGPAGMFCALYLARAGYAPLVFERGKDVDERKKSVDKFFNCGILDPNSNIQFGEGGAGAFSDGKLNTGVNHPLTRTVLRDFVEHGAPKEIEYLAKPHVGSDNLPIVVKNIRQEIERLGGKVLFSSKFEGVKTSGGKVVSITVNGSEVQTDVLVLAIGHSARDTFELLYEEGVPMERKAFAMGVRIEHLQRDTNIAQYGEKFARLLPAADYRLASRKGERGVFTFCMCPGGYVMPSASEEGGVVTNGMSLYARDGVNSNSAVLCEVYPSDFLDGTLGGVELQRRLERSAFALGGGDYKAPVQTLGDFFSDRRSTRVFGVKPTYSRGYVETNLGAEMPKFMRENLKIGIADMDRRLKGFACSEAVLTGFETRSSSPIRILRGENFQSSFAENFYPCGEGCGYAGGIMSAAVDGIKAATAISEEN